MSTDRAPTYGGKALEGLRPRGASVQSQNTVRSIIHNGTKALADGIKKVTGIGRSTKDPTNVSGGEFVEQESDSRIQKRNDDLMRYMMSQFDVLFHQLVQEMRDRGSDPVALASFKDEATLRSAFMADFVAYYTAEHLDQIDLVDAHTVELHEMKERMRTLLEAMVTNRGDVVSALQKAGIGSDT